MDTVLPTFDQDNHPISSSSSSIKKNDYTKRVDSKKVKDKNYGQHYNAMKCNEM